MPLENPFKKLVDEVEDTLRNLLSLLRFAAFHHLTGRLHQLSIELPHDLCEPDPQLRLAHNEVNRAEFLLQFFPLVLAFRVFNSLDVVLGDYWFWFLIGAAVLCCNLELLNLGNATLLPVFETGLCLPFWQAFMLDFLDVY